MGVWIKCFILWKRELDSTAAFNLELNGPNGDINVRNNDTMVQFHLSPQRHAGRKHLLFCNDMNSSSTGKYDRSTSKEEDRDNSEAPSECAHQHLYSYGNDVQDVLVVKKFEEVFV